MERISASNPGLDAEIRSACLGDDQAFNTIWRALNPSLVRYLRTRAPDLAEDAAADTWLAVVKGLRSFEGDAAGFRSWLFTIARSKVVDAARKASRTPTVLIDDWTVLDPVSSTDVAAEVLSAVSTEEAIRLVSALPPHQAEIVSLRVLADLDVAAVAKIVKKSPGAVRVAQHRALKRLAVLLRASGTPAGGSPSDALPADGQGVTG
ncbi:MAG TPA: RNA polymerase sigma factor [Mycobacteriales bacterium]|nr:RNA polymerase sigma factor [Mycobacteriales bacterium]